MSDVSIANEESKSPLHLVLGELIGLWLLANAGYYLILPALGFDLSYNSAPILIALYFLLWAGVALFYYRNIFTRWLTVEHRIWVHIVWSLGFAALIWGLLYEFAQLPILTGIRLAPYTDILFATSWYFLPKSAEVLVQQILITVLVLDLSYRFHSFKKVVLSYMACFGGAHVILFLLNGTPTPYAVLMTTGAVLSSLVFPYFILRVKEGFVYTYTIHLVFYIVLAMLLHAWPPPGYIV
ncbi:MAG: hypothetical protein Q7J45_01380 [bacterium]|nr:hypothetical protein [bacterium]